MSEYLKDNKVAIRCSFCLTLNSLAMNASDDNSECEDCGKPILMDRPIKIAATDFAGLTRKKNITLKRNEYNIEKSFTFSNG